MLKVKKFATENVQGRVLGDNIMSDENDGNESPSGGEYDITLPRSSSSTLDLEPGPSAREESLKMRAPEGKKEGQASPSEGEYIEYITLPKNEGIGPQQESLPERRSEGRRAMSSTEQESLNMSDLGLPSSFSQRRRGQGLDRTFSWPCTVCKVTLTSEVTMGDHMNGKRHLKKLQALKLKQKNSEQILSAVAISNRSPATESKVLYSQAPQLPVASGLGNLTR